MREYLSCSEGMRLRYSRKKEHDGNPKRWPLAIFVD
jgi:hypothetical protein